MKKSIYFLLLGMLMTACSEDSDLALINESVQKDPAAQLAEDFFLSVHPDKTRTSNKGFVVDAIERQIYHAVGDTVLPVEVTRAAIDDSLAFEIQTITFHTGDQQGYAVVSDDERLKTVYYFTENGQLSDTADIAPLKEFIDSIPLFAHDEMSSASTSAKITRSTTTMLVSPILRTYWNQDWPYNLYAKACNCSSCSEYNMKGHNPIGCVATATAQAIIKCERFHGTFYGNKDIDFSSLPDAIGVNFYIADSTMITKVGQFMHEVALGCQIKFGCNGSSSHGKAAYHYLLDMGYDCSYVEGSIDTARLIQELQNGYPHLIGGSSSSSGHMWIIDGVRVENNVFSYHLNWGHGFASNGWSNGNPYTKPGTSNQYSSGLAHIYINSLN